MQAAGGINQDHVAGGHFRFANGAADNFERLVGSGAGPDRSAGGFGDLRELLAGGGTVDVGGDDQRAMAVLAQPLAHFSGRGGFARTLQADDHPDRRWLGGVLRLGFLAEQFAKFVADDFDDLLVGRKLKQNFGAGGFGADVRHD